MPRIGRILLIVAFAQLVALTALTGCGAGGQSSSNGPGVNGLEAERIASELERRSFRQFSPSLDASPRKGVVLSFFGRISLWAQYSKDGHAENEWEITAASYRVEKDGDGSDVTIYFNQPSAVQELPVKCGDCIQTSGVSISIRNVFDEENILFKLNDPENVLPSPFPVFESWTKFREDEIIQ